MAAAGPVLEVGQGEQAETTVPNTDNNASLTIPNQPIPPSPQTGESMPITALILMGGSLGFCSIYLVRKRKSFKK